MKRVNFAIAIATVVAAAFAATPSASSRTEPAMPRAVDFIGPQVVQASAEGRAVADWSLIAQNTIVAVGRRFPGEAAVYMGIVHAAIYDAVVAIEGGYRPFAITPTVPPNASVDAAVAAAAHRVLVERFPEQRGNLDDVYFAYLNEIPDGEPKTNGILVGEEVGTAMVLLRDNDGLDSIVPMSSDLRVRVCTSRPQQRHRWEQGCRACGRWPSRTHLNSGRTAPLPYTAGNTRTTSTK